MKLIAISYPDSYNNEHIIINHLFNNGLEIFHLRKPTWTIGEISKLLDMIDAQYHNRIVIHSHYNLCNNFNLKGIHFTSNTKHQIQKYISTPYHKSISCHSFEEIDKYKRYMDYCFISPLFNSISKEGYKSSIDIELLLQKSKETKIVALGGINDTNIKTLLNTSIYAVAVLGFIWNSTNPINAFEKAKHSCICI